MADEEQEQANPVEQLVELMVYAPIGLLYEYQDVLPQLVRRGKSQVQLARVLGQMAVRGRSNDPSAAVGEVAGVAASALARLITDVGAQMGLAPQPQTGPDAERPTPPPPGPGSGADSGDGSADDAASDDVDAPVAEGEMADGEVADAEADGEVADAEVVEESEADVLEGEVIDDEVPRCGGGG